MRVWLTLCALYAVLGWFGLVDGLWLVVPYIAALVVAREFEARPWVRHGLRVLAGAGAIGAVLAGVALWVWRDWITDPDDPDSIRFLGTVAVGLAVSGLLVCAVLAPRLRARLFPRLGLDPGSAVHATVAALFVITLVAMACSFALLYDEPGDTILLYLTDPLVALLSDIPLALAGVGWLITRNLRATLERLGFKSLTLRQAAWSAALAALFLVAVAGLDWLEEWLLPEIHALESRFTLKFANVSPWVGAPLLSLAAGVGEEAVFRGALQPRFGIAATALLFAALHVQYQLPGIIVIFLVGVALGLVKERTSTTFTALVHMLYDIGAFLLPDF